MPRRGSSLLLYRFPDRRLDVDIGLLPLLSVELLVRRKFTGRLFSLLGTDTGRIDCLRHCWRCLCRSLCIGLPVICQFQVFLELLYQIVRLVKLMFLTQNIGRLLFYIRNLSLRLHLIYTRTWHILNSTFKLDQTGCRFLRKRFRLHLFFDNLVKLSF